MPLLYIEYSRIKQPLAYQPLRAPAIIQLQSLFAPWLHRLLEGGMDHANGHVVSEDCLPISYSYLLFTIHHNLAYIAERN